ncbi:hypothetical protein E1176_13415 [Fulvivirga sp. RKSG066]|uniref:hypothetical protein n=1 Tax=Fulvivirga aurantia TaxID=2529383 RepID=UPI0012BCBB52|nr:hypothetical protein [Fulvivirga aurantia]MTI22023.1 hypothetical protein [Fulvivirga aurantia]
MRYPLVAFGFVAIVIAGFVLMFTNYNQSATSAFTEVIAEEEIDECYDKTMDAWFIEFVTKQNAGATMDEADEQASELALTNYDQCIAKR